ncbi:MAG: ABC-ATPase domain-containing protein [Spirochaetaceae bacterium]|nr:MAG: ABC-ATPase domain-containing protein [Spirochaetaceae bacterium]
MQSSHSLYGKLKNIDGKDYGAYQSLKGEYAFPDFQLFITQIPKDSYAPPHTGIYRIRVSQKYLGIPAHLFDTETAGIAYRDFLARIFSAAAKRVAKRGRGTGHSGLITLDTPAQAILDRSAVVFTPDGAEIRFFIGLPAKGRKINARLANTMLFEELPVIVRQAFANLDLGTVRRHIEAAEDAECLRGKLEELDLVAFIADGSILPRKSGTSDEPMEEKDAVVFHSPESLRVSVDLPHVGAITGLGIPRGVTLVVGGGYQGKSTLLHGIETGIYNHVPGDGRELCAAESRAVKIRAYSGRSVASVDISGFIDNLPFKRDTTRFCTTNASGSTSQAASIVEALEMDARVLLMDEDTCASNFMIRDRKMQELVKEEDEPITPYIDRVRWLYEDKGVSSIVVLGGVGDYFDVADTVIQMIKYEPYDATDAAKRIALESPVKRRREHAASPKPVSGRFVYTETIDPFNEYGKKSVYASEINRIHFGTTTIDLTDVEQLLELSQTKAIAQAILYLGNLDLEPATMKELIDRCMQVIKEKGPGGLSERISGHLAQVRGIEIACALNRLRTLKIQQR